MKKTIFFLIAVPAMALISLLSVSCQKTDPYGSELDGEWHLVSTTGLEMDGIDVYASFSGGSFVLYQRTGDMMRYYVYDGTYSLADDVLSGRYSDGSSLGSTYRLVFSDDGNTLEMLALNGSEELNAYRRSTIPEEVRNISVPAVKSASAGSLEPFL